MYWTLRLIQMAVIIAVCGTASAYHVTDSGTVIGAWGLMAAIAVTWLIGKGADAYQFGIRSVLPGWRPFLYVAGVTIAVTVGLVVFVVVGTLVMLKLTELGYLPLTPLR